MSAARKGRKLNDWRWVLGLTAVAVLVVEVLMLSLDMGPEPALVAAVVVLASVIVWSVHTLSETTYAPPPPPRAVVPARTAGADRRVRALRTGILFSRSMSGHSERLHETLVEVIDDQLDHVHGVSRSTAPEAAAEILGPRLTAFVNEPGAVASVANTKELTRIVTLIEQI